jgi:hypothetical protein
MQVPAQPLLHAPPLVDEIVAVIDQELQVTEDLLVGPLPARAAIVDYWKPAAWLMVVLAGVVRGPRSAS